MNTPKAAMSQKTITFCPNSGANPSHISFGHQAVTTVGKLVFNTDISRQGNWTSSEIQSTSWNLMNIYLVHLNKWKLKLDCSRISMLNTCTIQILTPKLSPYFSFHSLLKKMSLGKWGNDGMLHGFLDGAFPRHVKGKGQRRSEVRPLLSKSAAVYKGWLGPPWNLNQWRIRLKVNSPNSSCVWSSAITMLDPASLPYTWPNPASCRAAFVSFSLERPQPGIFQGGSSILLHPRLHEHIILETQTNKQKPQVFTIKNMKAKCFFLASIFCIIA